MELPVDFLSLGRGSVKKSDNIRVPSVISFLFSFFIFLFFLTHSRMVINVRIPKMILFLFYHFPLSDSSLPIQIVKVPKIISFLF